MALPFGIASGGYIWCGAIHELVEGVGGVLVVNVRYPRTVRELKRARAQRGHEGQVRLRHCSAPADVIRDHGSNQSPRGTHALRLNQRGHGGHEVVPDRQALERRRKSLRLGVGGLLWVRL